MKKIISSLLLSFVVLWNVQAQAQEKYYVKHVEFPEGITLDQKVDMAARLVPTPQQLAWQKFEMTAFLHFGMNTFTGREWGDGKENPTLFHPTAFNAEQWVQSLKETGFNLVIITAKHHDGFCLWPTKTTKHSVASSAWKGGQGDVVGDLRKACEKYGMKFGIYLSPWDRNAECYGDSPRYNQFFIEQLKELLTNYGRVDEVWFDGANGEGPNGKKQIYDWDAFFKVIRSLQPQVVTAIMGDDVRWVGNESGLGRDTEWSATVQTPSSYARAEKNSARLGIDYKAPDTGGRELLEKATELFWYPSEVDVSIRPGWFYHEQEDTKVKSLKHLVDIYYRSVGSNSVLLLNIPPDRRGLINEADVNRLNEFAAYRNQMFAVDFVKNGKKYWKATPGSVATYTLKSKAKFNVVMLQEDISKGQRVETFTVEALTDNGWQEITKGTTIGYKRLLRFPETEAKQLRVRIDGCRLTAHVNQVAAYYAAPIANEEKQQSWNQLPRSSWKKISNSPLVIDLGKTVVLSGFTYAPSKAESKPTMAFRYQFFVSADGKSWKEISTTGEFSNIVNNPVPQTVKFGQKESARYVKLIATTPTDTKAEIEINEIGVSL